MGFFKWLFRKKKIEIKEDEWDQIIYERDNIKFHDSEDRKRYLTGCLEQIEEAEKEINLLTGEYSLVTSYLTDMEEIEALPPEQMAELKLSAVNMQTLEQERKRYLDKKLRMTDSQYRQMRSQEEEVEEGIQKLREAEQYQKLVRQDLTRLGGERDAYGYRKGELKNILVNLRGMAAICLTALGACIIMLLILQFGFELNTVMGYYIAIVAAAIAITVLFVKYMDAEKELSKVEKATNRLIQLQNTVKIRYINNVNLLDYLYLKYNVENVDMLQDLWQMYLEEKEERRQYAEAEAKLDYHRKQLILILSRYRIKDPDRWVYQPGAILDTREMIEIRHGLIVRRQALRKQLDYNKKLAETAQNEIKEVAEQYPQYAKEIYDMVNQYTEK